MQIRANSRLALLCAVVLVARATAAQKQDLAPRILSAKSVYFKNATGSEPVGQTALAALKKWGKYQIVADPKQAELIFLLSADPYKAGDIIFANGQASTVDNSGTVTKDPHSNFNKLAPTRYAYLTVIDAKAGYILWTDSHVWGGLLTGFNSAGARLIRKLEKQTKK